MIAFLRPDAWDFPLFVHVLGAIVLFGGVAAVVMLSFAGATDARAGESSPAARPS